MNENAKAEFNNNEISIIKGMISKSNSEVQHTDGKIDLSDKSFDTNVNNSSPFISFASTNKRYTYRHFWWGTRFYFRSNAAVNQMVHELKASASNLAAFGVGAGGAAMVAGPYAAIPGMLLGFAAWKYNKMADDLQYYNETHKNIKFIWM